MKKIFPIISAVAIINLTAIFILFRAEAPAPDSVAIHYAIQTTMESGSAQEAAILQTAFLSQAFKEMDTARRNRDNTLQILMYINVSALVFFCVFQYQYYKRKILNPFHKLQSFAGRIAAGDLDIPLEMDRENIFGTFTESFDIMRDELKTARENEIKANKSKKELIASLVHDITTPVASVKSAMDFLLLKINDENDIKIIDSANKKLEQIDTLITDMFHSTLEELQELKVTPNEIQSVEIHELIRQADYKKCVKTFSIPDCIVFVDLLRLQQVFDNIIKNSYKYADTDIVINAFIEEEHLYIEVKDFGHGVPEKELALLTSKFYRGKNTEKTDGYGLGLYLTKYFMERMSGGIYLENRDDGFMVVIMLRLA